MKNSFSKTIFLITFGLSIRLDRNYFPVSGVLYFPFFFFLMYTFQLLGDKVHCLCTVHALFAKPTTTLFRKNIKNGFHGTLHTFKIYFATLFLVFNFHFSTFSKISCIQTNPFKGLVTITQKIILRLKIKTFVWLNFRLGMSILYQECRHYGDWPISFDTQTYLQFFMQSMSSILCASMSKLGALAQNIFIYLTFTINFQFE